MFNAYNRLNHLFFVYVVMFSYFVSFLFHFCRLFNSFQFSPCKNCFIFWVRFKYFCAFHFRLVAANGNEIKSICQKLWMRRYKGQNNKKNGEKIHLHWNLSSQSFSILNLSSTNLKNYENQWRDEIPFSFQTKKINKKERQRLKRLNKSHLNWQKTLNFSVDRLFIPAGDEKLQRESSLNIRLWPTTYCCILYIQLHLRFAIR